MVPKCHVPSHGLYIENRAFVVGQHTKFESNNCNRLTNKETYALQTDASYVLQLESLLSAFVIQVHRIIWTHLDERVHPTISSAFPTSHCAYQALFSTRTLDRVAVCFAVAFQHVKQAHCCTWKWNYVRKEWHFAADEVWGNLQDSSTGVKVNSFAICLSDLSVFKQWSRQ